ncbi:MAG: ComEA family DNA-binding protein [Flavobacteriaceae bacterium]
MSYRKQPLGFYHQKLKVVFVCFFLLLVFNWLRNSHRVRSSAVDFDREVSRYWSLKIDSLITEATPSQAALNPFNPNYLSDYRAYVLGLPTSLVDRIAAHRAAGQWIRKPADFQQIAQLPDTTMERLLPYFKFPKPFVKKTNQRSKSIKKDINSATLSQLEAVYGIGAVLADRILRYKESLQAFTDMDQLDEVYGLSPAVLQRLKNSFVISDTFSLQRLAFETASLGALAALPYVSYEEARWLVRQRTQQPDIPLDSLLNQAGCSLNKVQRIKLYLY